MSEKASTTDFAGMSPDRLNAATVCLGNVLNIHILGLMSASVIRNAVVLARGQVPPSGEGDAMSAQELMAVETVTVAYMWRVARRLLVLNDADPFALAVTLATVPPTSDEFKTFEWYGDNAIR